MSLNSLQGYVQTTPIDQLDESRYEYITLSQTEPNLGAPESDGAILISNIDGTRSFTTSPTLSGLNFKANTLTEVETTPQYFLVLKGDPTDGIADSVGWTLGDFEEKDTLFTVTQPIRGVGHDSTDQRLTMYGLFVTDSATIGGDLRVLGNLQIEGTQTILNTETVTIEDKSLVIGQGSPDALAADSSGIIIAGTGLGDFAATMLYRYPSDTFNFSRGIVAVNRSTFDSAVIEDLSITGQLSFDSVGAQDIFKQTGDLRIKTDNLLLQEYDGTAIARFSQGNIQLQTVTTVTDSANLQGKIFATDVPPQEGTVQVLFRRTSDGLIMEGDIDIANVDKVSVQDTDSNATHYLLFSYANGGAGGFDSAYGDFADLTYNPATNLLAGVNADFRGITDLDSTNVEGDLQITTANDVAGSGRLLDSAGRSFVIYDSAGNLLWGNNGTSAGNLGGPQAAVLYLDDLFDVNLTTPTSGQVLKFDGVEWINAAETGGGGGGGISLTDLSVVQNAASGTGNLSYNDVNGVFTYTPPVIPTNIPSVLNDLTNVNATPTNGQVLKWDQTAGQWVAADDLAGGGSGTFLALTDTPVSWGTAGQVPVVNSSANGLEFVTLAGGGGATDIASLTDTSITSLQSGDILQYNGTAMEWRNVALTYSFANLSEQDYSAPQFPYEFHRVVENAATVLRVQIIGSTWYFDQYQTGNPTIYVRAGTTIGFDVDNLDAAGQSMSIYNAAGQQVGSTYSQELRQVRNGEVLEGTAAQGAFDGTLYFRPPGDLAADETFTYRNASGSIVGNIQVQAVPIAGGGGGGAGLASRTTPSGTVTSLGNGADADLNIANGFPTYALLKIQTSVGAWVRIYTDTTSRTNDAGRLISDDPAPDAGVIAEVITSGSGSTVVKVAPATIGWLESGTSIPVRVRNLSGSTTNVTVTLTAVELEV